LASGLLARLAKEGVDPLRDSGVREALKRLIYDCFEGLAKQLFKPVVVSTAFVARPILRACSLRVRVGVSNHRFILILDTYLPWEGFLPPPKPSSLINSFGLWPSRM